MPIFIEMKREEKYRNLWHVIRSECSQMVLHFPLFFWTSEHFKVGIYSFGRLPSAKSLQGRIMLWEENPENVGMCLQVYNFCVLLMKHWNVIPTKQKWKWNPFCVRNWRTGYRRDLKVILLGNHCQGESQRKSTHSLKSLNKNLSFMWIDITFFLLYF